jgi:hypothetical protein
LIWKIWAESQVLRIDVYITDTAWNANEEWSFKRATNCTVPETLDWRMRQMNSNLPLNYSLSNALAHGVGNFEEIDAENPRDSVFVDHFSDSSEDPDRNEEDEEVENTEEEDEQQTDDGNPPFSEDKDKENRILDSVNDSRTSTTVSAERLAALPNNHKRKVGSLNRSDSSADLERMMFTGIFELNHILWTAASFGNASVEQVCRERPREAGVDIEELVDSYFEEVEFEDIVEDPAAESDSSEDVWLYDEEEDDDEDVPPHTYMLNVRGPQNDHHV